MKTMTVRTVTVMVKTKLRRMLTLMAVMMMMMMTKLLKTMSLLPAPPVAAQFHRQRTDGLSHGRPHLAAEVEEEEEVVEEVESSRVPSVTYLRRLERSLYCM